MNLSEAQEILGLQDGFTVEELENAYRNRASSLHPDKGGDTDEMSKLNIAKSTLEGLTVSNDLPVVIKQFETAIRETNRISLRQHALEKKSEKTEKEIRKAATNKLKKWRQIAILCAAITGSTVFLSKSLPDELLEYVFPEIPDLQTFVDSESPPAPEKPAFYDAYQSSEGDGYDENASKEVEAYKVRAETYRMLLEEIEEYHEKVVSDQNRIKSFFYITIFFISIYSAFGAWFFNRKIHRTEEIVAEFSEYLSIKSRYVKMLRDIFTDEEFSEWIFDNLVDCLGKYKGNNTELSALLDSLGERKLAEFIVARGLELGHLVEIPGNIKNHYIEKYTLD